MRSRAVRRSPRRTRASAESTPAYARAPGRSFAFLGRVLQKLLRRAPGSHDPSSTRCVEAPRRPPRPRARSSSSSTLGEIGVQVTRLAAHRFLVRRRAHGKPAERGGEQKRANLHDGPRTVAPPPFVRTTNSSGSATHGRASRTFRSPAASRAEAGRADGSVGAGAPQTAATRRSLLSAPGRSVRTVLPRKSEPQLRTTARAVAPPIGRAGVSARGSRRRDGQPPDGDVRGGVQPDPERSWTAWSGTRTPRSSSSSTRTASSSPRAATSTTSTRRRSRRSPPATSPRPAASPSCSRENEFATQFHEGEKANIHIQLVGNRVILVVIFDSQVEPRPRAPAREEGERGAEPHLRGAAEEGAGARRATRRSPRSPTTTSTTSSTTEEPAR